MSNQNPIQARTPYPWQLAGRDFLVGGGSCLAFDPGLGKTLAALLADQAKAPHALPLLVACPVVAVGVWLREIPLVYPDARIHVVSGPFIPLNIDVVIVTLDLPARNAAVGGILKHRRWRRLIVDETHKLKTPTATRTKFWFMGKDSIAGMAPEVWLLTGTPAPNGRCDEMYSLIMATQPDRLKAFPTFAKFCDFFSSFKMIRVARGPARRVISGNNPASLPYFRERIGGWMLRLKKDSKMLPPKLRRVIPLQSDDLAEYDGMMNSMDGQTLALAIRNGNLDNLPSTSLSRLRHVLSRAKAAAAVNWIAEALDEGEPKIVTFAWHIEALLAIGQGLTALNIHWVMVTGATTAEARAKAVETFQLNPHVQVFLGQIAAAGTAITLTAARRVVFAESTWVPGDNLQAEDRCHRIGQTGTVVVDYLVTKDTIDEILMAILASKTADIERLGA